MFLVVSAIIKDSLKLKNKDADMVLGLHDAAEEFTGLIYLLVSDKHAGNFTPSINEVDDLSVSLISMKCIQTRLLLIKIKELWRAAVFLLTLIKYPGTDYLEILDSEEVIEKRASLYIIIEKSVLRVLLAQSGMTVGSLQDWLAEEAIHCRIRTLEPSQRQGTPMNTEE